MTTLVTGASGYIGERVAKAISQTQGEKSKVLVMGRHFKTDIEHTQKYIYRDINDLIQAFKDHQITRVIHLAATVSPSESPENVTALLRGNFDFGVELLEVMKAYGCKELINTGTCWEQRSEKEDSSVCLYAALKKAYRGIIDFYCKESGLKAVTMRLFDVYGPHDHRRKIFQLVREHAEKNQGPFSMSPGEQLTYLTHVDDVVHAFEVATKILSTLNSGEHGMYDIRGEGQPLKEAINQYIRTKNIQVEINWGGLPYRNNQLMRPVLYKVLPGWFPKISFQQGLQDL
jgi:nucleoside-diphosphate-sugar epimerase